MALLKTRNHQGKIMDTSTVTNTFQIVKVNRKWIECKLKGYKAKLLSNDVSKDLRGGDWVSIQVVDLSVRNKYGTDLKFEPVAIVEVVATREACQKAYNDKVIENAAKEQLEKAERLMTWAENDVEAKQLWRHSIKNAMSFCCKMPEFAARLEQLKAAIKEVEKANAQQNLAAFNAAETRRKNRKLYLVEQLPELNQSVELCGQTVVFTGYGEVFRLNADSAAVEGSHLLGHEGDPCCYGYYRVV